MNKFRGQYMDMVHPSSDVKIADKLNNASVAGFSPKPKSAVSPAPEMKENVPDEAVEEVVDVVDEEAYESPFLTGVEVEKRPLGGSSSSADNLQSSNADSNKDEFDINDYVDLSTPELPADDGGKGELEPELVAGEETESMAESESESESESMSEPAAEPASEPVAESAPESSPELSSEPTEDEETSPESSQPSEEEPPAKVKTPISVSNAILNPPYQINDQPTSQPAEPETPFAHAVDPAVPIKAKKPSLVWAWILLFVLLAVAGAATGALIYLSGWLG